MDRLYETLDDRMNLWRQGISLARQEQHGLFTLFRKKEDPNEKRLEDLQERLKVALEIAEALEYLHSLNILHRDIKPDNIGFDIDGNIQLIDFGLAKELKESDKNINGKYELTGNTGVWCYMAPEVAKGWAYDKTVDVYSFGILLWEICALERPFSQYTKEEHTNVNGRLTDGIAESTSLLEDHGYQNRHWSCFVARFAKRKILLGPHSRHNHQIFSLE